MSTTDNTSKLIVEKVDEEINQFRTIQEEINKHKNDLQTLIGQQNENEMVKDELDIVEKENNNNSNSNKNSSDGGEAQVYKLIGPVLMKNSLDDAKSTVTKRLEFINDEINKLEKTIKSKEDKSQKLAVSIQTMQQNMQKAAVQAAQAIQQQQAGGQQQPTPAAT